MIIGGDLSEHATDEDRDNCRRILAKIRETRSQAQAAAGAPREAAGARGAAAGAPGEAARALNGGKASGVTAQGPVSEQQLGGTLWSGAQMLALRQCMKKG